MGKIPKEIRSRFRTDRIQDSQMIELSEPISTTSEISAESLTERLSRNGFLRSGQVELVEETDTFDSSAAVWYRLKLSFSADYDGDVPADIVLKCYREGWFGGGLPPHPVRVSVRSTTAGSIGIESCAIT
jgi:hypothetical protein